MTIFFIQMLFLEGDDGYHLPLPCGEQSDLAGLASPCHLFLKGAKETAHGAYFSFFPVIEKIEGYRVTFWKENAEGYRVTFW